MISKGLKTNNNSYNPKFTKNTKLSQLSAEDKKKIKEKAEEKFKKDHPHLNKGTFITKSINEVFSTADTVGEAVEQMCEYTQVCDLSLQQKNVIKKLQEQCPSSNKTLKAAIKDVVNSMDSFDDGIKVAFKNAVVKQGADLTGKLMKAGWDAAVNVNPYAAALSTGASIGTAVGDTICNYLFSTDKTIEQYVKMKCLCEVEQLMQSVMLEFENTYKKDRTNQNANNYIESVDVLMAISTLSSNFAVDYRDIIYKNSLVGKLISKKEKLENFDKKIQEFEEYCKSNKEALESDYLNVLQVKNPKAYRIIMGIDTAEREIVLVLDKSGSMEGEPLEQTKQASRKFIDTVMEEDSKVAVVSYSDSGNIDCELTRDIDVLQESIDGISAENMTNTYNGLIYAEDILNQSDAEKKIIVLMTDGLPNEGKMVNDSYQEALVNYAKTLKDKGYYLYTLGFFSSVAPEELAGAQQMLGSMASSGYHYEVEDADDLVFFFDDIAGQISGTKYVYIRIACPVDVSVKCNGEELSSAAETENTRTSFGTLMYENIEETEDTEDTEEQEDSYENPYAYAEEPVTQEDKVKILRLNMDNKYDIDISGYGDGTMDYSVSYPDENGEYTDVRDFPGIKVTSRMKATSNTEQSDASILKVDENGDGTFEKSYETQANGTMKEVKDNTILLICLGAAAVIILCLIITLIVVIVKSKKKKQAVPEEVVLTRPHAQTGKITGMFGKYQGREYTIQSGMICTVGRSSSCNVQINDKRVSRIHCTIELLPDGDYQVMERSSNGTYYNDVQLERGKSYRIPRGALLAIGDADNVLLLE